MSWIIVDWAGNRLFPDMSFDSFENGWNYVSVHVTDESSHEDIFIIPA